MPTLKKNRSLSDMKFENEVFSYKYILKAVLYLIIPLFTAMSCLAVIQHRYSNLGILSLMLLISILVVIVNRTGISEARKIKFVGISFKIQVFSFGVYLLYCICFQNKWELLPWTFLFAYLSLLVVGIRIGFGIIIFFISGLLAAYGFGVQPEYLVTSEVMIRFFPALIFCAIFLSSAEYVRIDYRNKLTETNLRLAESKEKYREMIEYLPIPVGEFDFDFMVTYANRAAAEWFGYTGDTRSSGVKVSDLIPREFFAEIALRMKEFELGKNPGPLEIKLLKKDGSELWGQITSSIIQKNQRPVGIRTCFVDLTQRKRAEEALKKSEELFKLITGHTSALVSIHDANGNYIFASPSHEQLGFKPQDLLGKSGFKMMVEADVEPLLAHLEETQKGKLSKAFLNYRLKDKRGGIHYFRGSFDAVFKQDGALERIVCVGEDITELRQVQKEKEDALFLAAETEKLALVGQIAGKMAHDFNNILGVVMGNSELALLDCPHEQTRQALELIFEQTLRGKNLTKNLVAFAKDQEPKQEFFLIDEKMELVLNLMKKDLEGINVSRQYSQGMPELLADPGMIEHAIVNLVQNSIHATSLVACPRIIVRTSHRNGRILLEIEDNGCGIPREFIGEIFEPSFTLKGRKDTTGMYKPGIKGTGYGMSNVKKYIDQHKGNLLIHSEVKKGTRVTISLPVIKKELTDQEIKEVKRDVQKGKICFGKQILLVEDEQAISDVQYRILTHDPCNHKVDIANNGQNAMALFKRNRYDLVSLDYILPGDINGMDVYHHIRATDKKIPILFISGNIEFLESIKELSQRDARLDHLSKPCQNKAYITSINGLFERAWKGPH